MANAILLIPFPIFPKPLPNFVQVVKYALPDCGVEETASSSTKFEDCDDSIAEDAELVCVEGVSVCSCVVVKGDSDDGRDAIDEIARNVVGVGVAVPATGVVVTAGDVAVTAAGDVLATFDASEVDPKPKS